MYLMKLVTSVLAVAGLSATAAAWGLSRQETAVRGEGERCMGAPGYPPIEWIPCDTELDCVEAPELGWGKFCVGTAATAEPEEMEASPEDEPDASPEEPEESPEETVEPPSGCAPNWNRCEGDETISWPTLSCCDSEGYECVTTEEVGYLGKRCEPKKVVPVTVPGGTLKTCADNWQTCGGRGAGSLPCCDPTYACVDPEEESYFGLRCEPVA